VKREKKKAI